MYNLIRCWQIIINIYNTIQSNPIQLDIDHWSLIWLILIDLDLKK